MSNVGSDGGEIVYPKEADEVYDYYDAEKKADANDMFSDYINRAKLKIRRASSLGSKRIISFRKREILQSRRFHLLPFLDIAKYVIEKWSFSDRSLCRDSNGMNALHAAVIRTHLARFLEHHVPDLSIKTLRSLIRGILLHAEGYFGRLPRTRKKEIVITQNNILSYVEQLEPHDGAPYGPDIVPILREETQNASLLEEQENLIKWTPLHFAAYLGHLQATKLILQQKYSSVAYLREKEGMSALHIAAKEGHVRVMNEIIRQRPQASDLVDDRDKDGNTPLHLAAGLKKHRIMMIPVDDCRVDKRATNHNYLKPIDIVRTNANIGELVRKLERQGGRESLQSLVYRGENGRRHFTDTKEGSKLDHGQPIKDDNKDFFGHHPSTADHKIPKNGQSHEISAAEENLQHPSSRRGSHCSRHFSKCLLVDSTAFYCSSASVLIQFFSSIEHNYYLLLRFTRIVATLTYISVFRMVAAFTSGLHVVMPSSSSLAYCTLLPCADAVIGTSGATVSYIRHASGATVSIQETWGNPTEMTNCMANAAAGSAQAQPAAPTALGYDSYAAHGCVYASPLNNAGHARPMAETVEQTSDTKCSTFWFGFLLLKL
ncbi:hypothetical protein TIFTF001_042725 [Ficus carica]|uniref:PGG domain-containing protein n=1 Tax=Ficus carica TaxID=3494 RepID=A0AA87ZPN4_FICCA|nr:hypothetical protein TIFTF001_042725 [Ficus carica]